MTSSPRPGAPARRRVLVDLSHAAAGYVGIAQDIRLIFDMLTQRPDVEPVGLLMPAGRHDLPRLAADAPDRAAVTAGVLHWMARNWASRDYPRVLGRFGALLEVASSLRAAHDVVRLHDHERTDALWRILFDRTLPPERRPAILAAEFQATDLSVMRIIDRLVRFPFLAPKTLRVRDCDAVLFSMPRPVRLPAGITPIMRFHDAIPLSDPDTVESWKVGLVHERLVARCTPETLFVCNSPQSREAVIRLQPERAARAHVIPCAIAPPPRTARELPCAAIIARRRTRRLLQGSDATQARWPALPADMRYVLSVSTLEPRKNYAGLVRAWERAAARTDGDLRLVVVANRGWLEDAAAAVMRPHIRTGRLLHLEDVPPDELASLMRQAACFAFPSFNEGFGYAPLEALQEGTPSIVSDLPVFRWIFGESALYVDPYDIGSIADGIERLCTAENAAATRAALTEGRERVLARFRPDTVGQMWSDLIGELPERPA